MQNGRTDVSIVLGGPAGTGIQTIEAILLKTFKACGLHVFSTKEYMSRVRGGSNSVEIRVGHRPVRAFVDRTDIMIPFDRMSLDRLRDRCQAQTLLAGDPDQLGEVEGISPLPLQQMAKEAGGKIFANSIACGFLVGVLGLDTAVLDEILRKMFADKGEGIVEKNVAAARLGSQAAAGVEIRSLAPVSDQSGQPAGRLLLNGSQAVGLGAIGGGCTFLASYPMSPSTGVLTFLAKQAGSFGIVVEQAEDEIAAINMGIGSWYAGGRALVTTSGGGFALMTEGVSLAGGMESPMVIHLAQRPGPATGLPTRTEQGDLDLALYAGHGEFPRLILAPGNHEEAFTCTRQAFAIADASQCPVFVLTDQYLLDSYYDVETLSLPEQPPVSQIVETGPDYQRYALTEDGLSPRGIPGFGAGLVCADSDEHDEGGFITEDPQVRMAMVDKRLQRFDLLCGELALPPRLYGPESYRRLIIGWGSTCEVVSEALAMAACPETAFLHCRQVFPLPEVMLDYLDQAERLIVIENNATGQFARLIQREFGLEIDEHWLKYDGSPFSVEAVAAMIVEEVE